MSLINQVLQDLDRRRLNETEQSPVGMNELHIVQGGKSGARIVTQKQLPLITIALAVICVIAIALAVVAWWPQRAQQGEAQTTPSVVERVATAEPAQASAVIPANDATSPMVIASEEKPVVVTSAPVVSTRPQTSPTREVSKQEVTQAPAQKVTTAPVVTRSDSISEADPFSKRAVPQSTAQQAEQLYQSAYAALQQQHTRQAERDLRAALHSEAGHDKARELLTGLYIQQGRWLEANELLRDGVALSPANLTLRKLYARSLMQLQRDSQAIAVLTGQTPAMQVHAEYYAILAALYQRTDQHQPAAELYARILKVQPDNGVWWVGMGISLEKLGRQADAAQAYAHARQTGNLQAAVRDFTDQRLQALKESNYPQP